MARTTYFLSTFGIFNNLIILFFFFQNEKGKRFFRQFISNALFWKAAEFNLTVLWIIHVLQVLFWWQFRLRNFEYLFAAALPNHRECGQSFTATNWFSEYMETWHCQALGWGSLVSNTGNWQTKWRFRTNLHRRTLRTNSQMRWHQVKIFKFT